MSRASRQSLRRISARQRSRQQSWLRRYLKALSTGVTAASLGAASLFTQSAFGGNDVWSGATNNKFNGPTNWTVGSANKPPITGDSIEFASSGAGGSGVAGLSLLDNLGTPGTFTINGFTFDSGAAAYTILANNGVTLTGGITNNSSATETINDNLLLSGTDNIQYGTSAGTILIGGILSGTGNLTMMGSNAGTLTLTGANTFNGGINLNTIGDILNINNGGTASASALGVGALTINANSTINNTSGAAITVATNNAVNLSADLTFTGTSNLNLGTGNVTLGGAAGTRTITVSAGNLTLGPIGGGGAVAGIGLTLAGPGTLTVADLGTSNIGGNLTVNSNATFNMMRNTVLSSGGGLLGSGLIQVGTTASGNRTLTVNPSGSANFTGTLSNNFVNAVNRTLGVTMNGTGTQTLSGTLNYTGATTVSSGILTITSPLGTTSTFGPAGAINIANVAGSSAILNISADMRIAANSTWNVGNQVNANGAVYQTGGNVTELNFNGATSFKLGAFAGGAVGTGSYGYYNLSNGSLTNNEIGIGGGPETTNGSTGVFDMSGGTFNEQGWITIARGQNGTTGILNMTGGTINATGQFGGHLSLMNETNPGFAFGQVSVKNAQILAQSPGTNYSLTITDRSTAGIEGVVNLNANGLVRVGPVSVNAAGQTGLLNFNGGTLQAAGSSTAYMTSANLGGGAGTTNGVFINAGGGKIDNNGYQITISAGLEAPIGFGMDDTTTIAIPVAQRGSLYVGAPAVLIGAGPTGAVAGNNGTGASGFGATAVANMEPDPANPGYFRVASITITNPGDSYGDSNLTNNPTFVAPTITFQGGTNGTLATLASFATKQNVSGGVTFAGSGVTTITNNGATAANGVSTYTGATSIPSGTVVLGATAVSATGVYSVTGTPSLNSSSGITVGTVSTSAALVVNSTVAVSPTGGVTLTNGRVDGGGTITTLNVADLSTNIVANGSRGTFGAVQTTLPATYTNLTFNGAGQLNPVTNNAAVNAVATPITTTTLTANGAVNSVKINPTDLDAAWAPGTYHLASYSGAVGGIGLTAFQLGTTLNSVAGIGGGRQTVAIDTSTVGQINMIVTGDTPRWTGLDNSTWTAGATGASSNWLLPNTALTPATDFQAADAVIFDDNGANTTTVNIAGASVTPSVVVFRNTSAGKAYVIGSTGGFGINSTGSLLMTTTGSVTLNTANTFPGGVTVTQDLTLTTPLAGTLNIGNAGALGSGPLRIDATATIDNTSNAAITLTNSSTTIRGSFTFAGTANDLNTGTGPVNLTAASTMTVNGAGRTLTLGGPINSANANNITKAGLGTLVLAGDSTGASGNYGALTVTNGIVRLTGKYATGGNSAVAVGNTTNQNSVLQINGGTLTANLGGLFTRGVTVGSANTSAGSIKLTNNGTFNTLAEFGLGTAGTGAYGAFTMDSGIANFGAPFRTGLTGDLSVVNQSGGTVNVLIGKLQINDGGTNAVTVYNLSGAGIVNATSLQGPDGGVGGVWLNNSGTGTTVMTMSGTSQLTVDPLAVFSVNNSGTGTGTLNLSGTSLLTVPAVAKAGGTGNLNLHGGTLRANNASTAFITAGTTTTLYSEGATIDDNGNSITIGQAIIAPAGAGITGTPAALTITNTGTPYIDTPIVTIGGGGGTGATAVANIDANGLLTGITVTNPGINYSNPATLTYTLSGGGVGNTSTIVVNGANAALGTSNNANTGVLTKVGSGILTLTGASTFGGGLTLTNGTLNINNGGNATSSAIGTGPLTITGGTIDNTTGGLVTIGTNNAQNWNANVVYGGTNSLNMGTGAVTMNATRTVTTNGTGNLTIGGGIGPAASGFGLIKSGPGRLLLTGTSVYDGPTTINQGKLVLSGANAGLGSSGIAVNNGATFVQDSTNTTPSSLSVPVHVFSGGVDGNGTQPIGAVTVEPGASNFVANGDGASGSLRIGTLNFLGAAAMNLTASAANLAPSGVATVITSAGTNSITTGGAATIQITASNPTGWASGTYELVSYVGSDPFSAFKTPFNISGLSGHGTATPVDGAGFIGVNIITDTPIWTGKFSHDWTPATLPSPKNWVLQTAGTATDFLTNDNVLFDNSANTQVDPGNVNLADDVSPATVTFNNDVAHPYSLASQSVGGTTFNILTGSITKSGLGTVTLNVPGSTFAGGTTLSSGTLNINGIGTSTGTKSSIGTGALTITGGTVDSSDGGGTLATNNAQNWNGDFTYGGTGNLSFGNGAVTISGATGTTRTVTIGNNATITVGPINGVGAALPNLTLASGSGGGTLTVNSTTGSSNVGVLTVPVGMTLNIGAIDFHTTGILGTGTIQDGSNTTRWLFVNNASADQFDGVLQDGGTGRMGLNKSGAGTLILTGTSNTLSDVITVAGGQLQLTGSITPAGVSPALTGATVFVGGGTNNPILNIQGGSLNVSQQAAANSGAPGIASMQIGNGTVGVLKMSQGAIAGNSSLTSSNELWLGTGADSNYGAFDMADGSTTINGVLALGVGGGRGVLNMSNGTLNLAGNSNGTNATPNLPPYSLSVGNTGGAAGITHGTTNFSGGTTAVPLNVAVGDSSNGVMNVIGGQVTVTGSSFGPTAGPVESGVYLAAHTGATGTLNLVGGTLTTPAINAGSLNANATTDGGTAIVNFNGGTLQANASGTLLGTVNSPATLTATVYKKGAVIDDNFNSITISQPLLAATGSGLSGAGLTVTNTGTPYASTPTVTITGGGGSGATAIVNLNPDGTINTSNPLTITSPGTGYTSNPTFTLNGGGLNNTSSIAVTNPAITNSFLANNTGGGLTKLGAGNLTLSALNTYNGPTKVTAGTLNLGVNNAIGSASTLNMAGGNFNAGGFTDQLGTLRVTANSSSIDISGTGNLQFANSSLTHWRYSTNAAPVIVNVTGTSGVGSDFDANEIVFPSSTSLNANQLSQIQFNSTPGTYGALRLIGNTNPLNPYIGMYELVSTNTLPTGILTLGDINQDGTVNVRDISALMSALVNVKGYENGTAVYGGTSTPIRTTGGIFNDSQLLYLADVNFDDHVDNQDIQSLISYIASGLTLPPSPAPAPGSIPGSSAVTAVPEPGSIVLFVLGSIPGVWVMRKRFGRRGAEVEKSEV